LAAVFVIDTNFHVPTIVSLDCPVAEQNGITITTVKIQFVIDAPPVLRIVTRGIRKQVSVQRQSRRHLGSDVAEQDLDLRNSRS
jgi:hypothetical protein